MWKASYATLIIAIVAIARFISQPSGQLTYFLWFVKDGVRKVLQTHMCVCSCIHIHRIFLKIIMGKKLKSTITLKAGIYMAIFIKVFPTVLECFLLWERGWYFICVLLISVDATDQVLNFKMCHPHQVFNTCWATELLFYRKIKTLFPCELFVWSVGLIIYYK